MTEIYPDYYKKFSCTASKCRHSCCEHWEIDIDNESFEKYCSIDGILKDRLSSDIMENEDGSHSFKLFENERCPFLNEDNLCELILSYNEDILCDICREHPRFHTYYSDYVESGIGLCCEEAARLIITTKEPVNYTPGFDTDYSDITYLKLNKIRKKCLSVLHNPDMSYVDKLNEILSFEKITISSDDVFSYIYTIKGLEILDDNWKTLLNDILTEKDSVISSLPFLNKYDFCFSNILEYYLYRYYPQVFLGCDLSTVFVFSALSAETIRFLCALLRAQNGRVSEDDIIDVARMYSSEIEYSDSNMDEIFSVL